jgi:hypothetical protein
MPRKRGIFHALFSGLRNAADGAFGSPVRLRKKGFPARDSEESLICTFPKKSFTMKKQGVRYCPDKNNREVKKWEIA